MSNIQAEPLFFCGSLIGVSKSADEEAWGFSVRFGGLYSFNSRSIYKAQEEALDAAKYHALIDMCWRSRDLNFITSYPGDRIITQSEEMTAFLGGISTGLSVKDFYLRKQERIDALKELSAYKFVSSPAKPMQKMDGSLFNGIVTSRLFEFISTSVLLEMVQVA